MNKGIEMGERGQVLFISTELTRVYYPLRGVSELPCELEILTEQSWHEVQHLFVSTNFRSAHPYEREWTISIYLHGMICG